MNSTPATAPGLPPAEKHAGLILSIVFHLALFVLMLNGTFIRRTEVEPATPPIRVTLNPEPTPASPTVDSNQQQVPLRPLPVAATIADGITAEEPDPSQQNPTETEPAGLTLGDGRGEPRRIAPAPAPIENATEQQTATHTGRPKTEAERRAEEEKFARELQEESGQAVEAVNAQVEGTGSRRVADRLQAATTKQRARKWLSTTKGAEEGIIRSMDITDVPPRVAEEVLARYGITIMVKQLNDPDGGGYNFLNQAKTFGGTYHNNSGRGLFQVFTYSGPAVARMMQLEVEEMRRRGFDPAASRIVEVEFGIVRTTKGYDLGVRSIEIVPIPVEENPH